MILFKSKKLTFRQRLGNVIFNHDTVAAKIFDLVLLILIIVSSLVVILETVPSIDMKYGDALRWMEFAVILLFTLEYFARIYSARSRGKYIVSPYGIIDFISIFPAYLSILFPPLYYLVLFRVFRVFRIFRVLKLISFLQEEMILVRAVKKSFPKIIIFLGFILIISTIFASLMYVIEGPAHGFSDIPTSLYWTIVTITTVGYGDITPVTSAGKVLASLIMLSGYGVIAVPTGIIFSEYNRASSKAKKEMSGKN
jgi:voltage-gated potassium channel